MSSTSCVSLLRLGYASTGTLDGVDPVDKVLQRALKTHFENGGVVSEDTDERQGHLTISNRYFTARVALQPLTSQARVSNASAATTSTTGSEPSQQEDGVLLLFWEDAKTAHSLSLFDELASLHDQAERDDQCGELLRLCVRAYFGDHSSSSSSSLTAKQQEEEYARRILWCLDRGYEYIEADLSEEGVKQGHDVRDKDGFARIVEAISGTVWSSAVMNSIAKTQLQTSYQQTAEQLSQKGEKDQKDGVDDSNAALPVPSTLNSQTTASDESKSSSRTHTQPTTNVDGVTTNVNDTKEIILPLSAEEIKKADEKAQRLLVDESHVPGLAGQEETLSGGTPPSTPEDEEQDSMLQNFEIALREATRIRELSKNGALTDDERRQRASDAANLLMGMLDQMGFDDDDEDDEEEPETAS